VLGGFLNVLIMYVLYKRTLKVTECLWHCRWVWLSKPHLSSFTNYCCQTKSPHFLHHKFYKQKVQ